MKIKKQILLLLLITIANSLLAIQVQYTDVVGSDTLFAHIHLKSGIKQDRIHLRWAVDRPAEWQRANSVGFTLKRYTISKNGQVLDVPELNVLGTFYPAPQSRWDSIINTNDNAAIIAQSLYGDSFETELGNADEQTSVAHIANKSQELEQRFAYALMAADMDFEAAKFAGWGYTDTNVREGERYLYLVEINSESSTADTIFSIKNGSVVAELSMVQELPKPLEFMGIFRDKTVSLFWEYKQLQDFYTAYYIERADDGVNFTLLNNLPVINMNEREDTNTSAMAYIDSLQTNNQEYAYRIRGKNIFGEYGPYSDIVKGKGIKELQVSPRITSYELSDKEDIVLKWDFPTEAEKDIKEFELIHSETDTQGSYKVIKNSIPTNVRSIITRSIAPANYFKIVAVANSAERKESFSTMVQLNDVTPPEIPIELAGKIDSTGVAHITWKPNTEVDLEGYHVFRATQKGQEPVRITTQSINTAFVTDTVPIKSLNTKVYYYVLSVDKRKNESELSEVLELEKPDILPPQPPVFSEYDTSENGITVKWIKSYSKDVATHQLYRKAQEGIDQNWYIVFQTNKIMPEYSFTDKSVKDNISYTYHLIAVDKNGLRSLASKEITLRYINTKAKSIISDLMSFTDKRKNVVELNWKIESEEEEVVEIVVYRTEGSEKPALWGTLSGAQNFLEDKNVTFGKQYTYLLKAMLKSNRPTKTEKIVVIYE